MRNKLKKHTKEDELPSKMNKVTASTYEHIYDVHALVESVALSVGEGGDSVGEAELDALILAGMTPRSKIFDFGCGSGRLTKFLSKYLLEGTYVGSDISSEMVSTIVKRMQPTPEDLNVKEATSQDLRKCQSPLTDY